MGKETLKKLSSWPEAVDELIDLLSYKDFGVLFGTVIGKISEFLSLLLFFLHLVKLFFEFFDFLFKDPLGLGLLFGKHLQWRGSGLIIVILWKMGGICVFGEVKRAVEGLLVYGLRGFVRDFVFGLELRHF